MAIAKLYEGTTGFVLDIKILNCDNFSGITNAMFFVKPPKSKIEEEWSVTVEVDDGIFRHVVPDDYLLVPGTYRIQPYFEVDDFKGRWGTVTLEVDKEYSI